MEADENSTPTYESAGRSNRYVIYFGIFMLIGLGTLAWIGRPPIVTARGEKLPKLDLQPLIDAEPIDNASLMGKVTVMHFWGTWCHYCKLEFPEFVELADEFEGDQRVKIVSVSCSGGDAEMDVEGLAAKTREYLAQYEWTLPTYCDSAGMTRMRASMLLNGSFGYPTTLVIGPDGLITDTLTGYRAGDMLKLAGGINDQLNRIESKR